MHPQIRRPYVKVNGENYQVLSVGQSGEGKFFGRYRFRLQKLKTGERFITYGKRVQHNSTLLPIDRNSRDW